MIQLVTLRGSMTSGPNRGHRCLMMREIILFFFPVALLLLGPVQADNLPSKPVLAPLDNAAPETENVATPTASAQSGALSSDPPEHIASSGPISSAIPRSPRESIDIGDPIVQESAMLAMTDVNPVVGEAIGWRIVRADTQKFNSGTYYLLQVELWTKTRCEVHEVTVFQDARSQILEKQGSGDIVPCDASLSLREP